MMYSKALLVSLALHILLLLYLNGGKGKGEGDSKEKTSPHALHVKIIDKPDDLDQKEIVKTKSKVPSIKKVKPKPKRKKAKKDDCKDFYEGVGIVGLGHVESVYPGYPADVAGVKKGDYILSPPDDQIRGPKGTIVTLTIMRDGQILTFTIVRDRICIDGKSKP